jgi:hypothetical protein
MKCECDRTRRTPAILAIVAVLAFLLYLIWGCSYEFSGDANSAGTERFHRKYFGLVPYLRIKYLPIKQWQLRPLGTVISIAMTMLVSAAGMRLLTPHRRK